MSNEYPKPCKAVVDKRGFIIIKLNVAQSMSIWPEAIPLLLTALGAVVDDVADADVLFEPCGGDTAEYDRLRRANAALAMSRKALHIARMQRPKK